MLFFWCGGVLYISHMRVMKKQLYCRGYRHVTLRHTYATRLMRVTNIRTVQVLLGHRRLSSTQIYTHPDQEDKDKAIDKMQEDS